MRKIITQETLSVFTLTGKDTLGFLNNQVITALKVLPDQPTFTAICNPKGRIIFTIVLQQQTEETLIAVSSDLSDNFLQYINMRKFRMDLTIKISTQQISLNDTSEKPDLTKDLEFVKATHSSSTTLDVWWLWMFKLGLPWIIKATSECFIPQHLNLDQQGVIDFDKGCYPGQEIVARLHFLGKVNKRMQVIQYTSEHPFKPNQKIDTVDHPKPLEVCSPSFFYQNKWNTQAITAV